MRRKRWIWALLLIGSSLIFGVYAYLSGSEPLPGLAQGSNPDQTAIPQAVARRGDLTVSISGSGELVPLASSDLSFGQTGTLLEINVATGDQVKAGKTLARLRTDQTPVQHQAELASAQLAVIQAQQALDQVYANANLAAAQALTDVENSQSALEDLNHPEMEQAQAMQSVAKAEQAVETAKMNLYILQSLPSQTAIDIANASLLFKQKDYQALQKSIDRLENQIKSAPNETIRDRLEAQLVRTQIELARQKIEVDNASYQLANMGSPPDPDSLAQAQALANTAQAELDQARLDLEAALAGPSPADLAKAEAQLAAARLAWEGLKDGPDPVSLQQAQTQLAEAQAHLALVQGEKLVLELQAPFDGTVLSVNARTGDRVKDITIIRMADLSQPLVEVSVDETDLPGVQTGMEARVVFDALPDETFTGQVIQIDPSLQRFGNTYAAVVIVRLNLNDDDTRRLPIGMRASADILIGETTGAVLVPVEALHQLKSGETVVYVIDGDQLEPRPVTVGLMDLTMVEIRSGLQSGEAVATGTIDR